MEHKYKIASNGNTQVKYKRPRVLLRDLFLCTCSYNCLHDGAKGEFRNQFSHRSLSWTGWMSAPNFATIHPIVPWHVSLKNTQWISGRHWRKRQRITEKWAGFILWTPWMSDLWNNFLFGQLKEKKRGGSLIAMKHFPHANVSLNSLIVSWWITYCRATLSALWICFVKSLLKARGEGGAWH